MKGQLRELPFFQPHVWTAAWIFAISLLFSDQFACGMTDMQITQPSGPTRWKDISMALGRKVETGISRQEDCR